MDKMKRYEDFKNESNDTDYLTKEELERVKWTKYKIVVPTLEDKLELEKAFEHIHYSGKEYNASAVGFDQLTMTKKYNFLLEKLNS
jgi:hypothetical protein